jgi:hypothetical protein
LYIYFRLKKIAAILLLGILAFNWCGYQLLVSILEQTENSKLQTRLDENNYDEASLISIKLPATILPYYTNSKIFEPVEGQLEWHGVLYKFVERRTYNDTVELRCIPNQALMTLQKAKDNFFKAVNDLQTSSQNKKSGSHQSSKNASLDYCTMNDVVRINDLFFSRLTGASGQQTGILCSFHAAPEQPPQNC